MEDNYEIRTYTKTELQELKGNAAWWEHAKLPFTQARLDRYLSNPAASDDDVLWLIAWKGDEICAYLGLIPDRIKTKTGTMRLAWYSSWWADADSRGKGIARQLTSLGLNLYPAIGIDSGTPWSMRLMRENGDFFLYSSRPRSFWFLNLNQKALRDFKIKIPFPSFCLPIARLLIGVAYKARLRAWLRGTGNEEIQIEYITDPDTESVQLIMQQNQRELCVKDSGVLTWRCTIWTSLAQLKGLSDKSASYFGRGGEDVRSYLIKMWKRGKLIGVVNVCLADGYLKLPFLYMMQGHDIELAAFIARICRYESIDVVYTQNHLVKQALQAVRFPRWIMKSYPMDVLLSKNLTGLPKGLELQDGDGAF